MLSTVRPEEVGISSTHVFELLASLEKRGLHMHSLLLMRGENIFLDCYWAPFHKQLPHRMYSVTKRFVSVAVGLCAEDGLIDLDGRIADYFPEKIDTPVCENLKKQTVREMLTMTTAAHIPSWFEAGDSDRTHLYFSNLGKRRPSGTLWEYDSAGSQVLSALVEKITGVPLFDFLNQRIFKHLGSFQNAKILKTPNGDSWGDSAMICTPRDLAAFARFVMNYGVWNGQRLMNEQYLRTATSPVVQNRQNGHGGLFYHGYGYQFWMTEDNGFAFNGMGDQLAICMPKQDLIMVCTADNQGNAFSKDYLAAQFLDRIVANVWDMPLPQNDTAYQRLETLSHSLSLFSLKGGSDSPLRQSLNDAIYLCEENPMGWRSFSFHFEDAHSGELRYINRHGEMVLPFFVNENRFGLFPEEGYSKDVGGVRTTDGHRYRDAVSLTWTQDNKILLFAQIIDEYFGNLSLTFAFCNDLAMICASHSAEDFLWEYRGEALAKRIQ